MLSKNSSTQAYVTIDFCVEEQIACDIARIDYATIQCRAVDPRIVDIKLHERLEN